MRRLKRAPDADSTLTQDSLMECVTYDPHSGVFLWIRLSPKKAWRLGSPAGSKNPNGYVSIRIAGRAYQAHRLVWLYVYGRWPMGDIDHINGNRSDNRLCNLRECTRSENMQNVRPQSNNTSGHPGVTWNKARQKWVAQICHRGAYKNLGGFSKYGDACQAYLAAKGALHTFQPTPRRQ